MAWYLVFLKYLIIAGLLTIAVISYIGAAYVRTNYAALPNGSVYTTLASVG